MTATAGLASYVNHQKDVAMMNFISRRQPFLPCYTDSSAKRCCISNRIRVAEAGSTSKNVRTPASFY